MKTINEKKELEVKIALLKIQQTADLLNLKEQYHTTIESFKPINLIKNSLEDAMSSPSLKMNLINGAIGLGTNYLTKNVLNESSKNPVKRVLGKILQYTLKKFIERK